MKLLVVAMFMIASSLGAVTDEQYQALLESVEALRAEITTLRKSTVTPLARQVSQQQLYVEEMTRSHGHSGLKITRLTRTGSKPYFSTSFVDERVSAMHVHANYKQLVGMGEFIAVLNGVEFRTRHNDYKLKMPSTTSTEYGATEDIPLPPVPDEVLAQSTLEGQIKELREWFKAWRDSDFSVRDYRPYFKANLCYLEGMWTNADGNTIDEPFESDRHALEADSFFDLQQKIRYSSWTGTKSISENLAYLPTTIADVGDNGEVMYSQWNYKILCHPLKRHVPLSRFRLEDDLGVRVANGKTEEAISKTRAARFSLYEAGAKWEETFTKQDQFVSLRRGTYLDTLMSEIPGKNNYMANLTDVDWGRTPYATSANPSKDSPLNVGYYHNAYLLAGIDASGANMHRRGFSDKSVYFAYNTQNKITPVKRGTSKISRVSYAIPLEIIYTTPLNSWNPYNLKYHEKDDTPQQLNKIDGQKRTGKLTAAGAYNGISNKHYFMTPPEFYDEMLSGTGSDTADTGNVGKGVLDPEGNVRNALASGIFITTNKIPGVGSMRIRYPIMPIHEHGNLIYQDLSALTDMTLKQHKYQKLYPDVRLDNNTVEEVYQFETNIWDLYDVPGDHVHTFELTHTQIRAAISGKFITVTTSTAMGHDHVLVIKFDQKYKMMNIARCDGGGATCWDGHKGRVVCTEGDYPLN